jgi:hypothetical protein
MGNGSAERCRKIDETKTLKPRLCLERWVMTTDFIFWCRGTLIININQTSLDMTD